MATEEDEVQLPPAEVRIVAGGGASPFGNFYNYYSFNPVEQRFCYLPHDLASVLRESRRAAAVRAGADPAAVATSADGNCVSFLDVGCNEGNIAFAMAEVLARQLTAADAAVGNACAATRARTAVRGLGVDIDKLLISRAITKANSYPYLHAASTTATAAAASAAASTAASSTAPRTDTIHFELSFLHGNVMEPACVDALSARMSADTPFPPEMLAQSFFADAALPAEIPPAIAQALGPAQTQAPASSPTAVSASAPAAEPVTAPSTTDATASALAPEAPAAAAAAVAAGATAAGLPAPLFDVAFAFSVTLWIHLHNGDEGLQAFLRRLSSLARHIIIEPQPWKCYQTCRKRWRRAGVPEPPLLAGLSWRTDVDDKIVAYLRDECGMVVRRRLGETRWERQLVWLTRATDYEGGEEATAAPVMAAPAAVVAGAGESAEKVAE
jgi:SAM-dependent methyltransferase